MKQLIILIALILIAPTYYNDSSFQFNEYEHNITSIIGDRIVVDSTYGRFILKLDRCVQFDTHNWCLENLTHDPVEFYPNTHQIIIEHETLCEDDECVSYGQVCENKIDCTDYCVNEVCRPTQTWCGDGVCDENEVCAIDCPVNKTNTTETQNNTETNSTTKTNTTETQNNTETNSTTKTNTTETQNNVRNTISGEEPNYIGAGLTIVGGIAIIISIFVRKRKHKKEQEMYAYRK
jgi:hypothetical protein